MIREVSQMISEITGVQLGEKQYSLVQGRLAKRIRDLKLETPGEYARYLSENLAVETGVLVSLLTTHHTYFFREFSHFEYLLKTTLPRLIARKAKETGPNAKKIRIWSAACSRGQEVYSLAMFLRHHLPQIAPLGMSFEIIGSDICEESVGIARNGVYGWEEIKAVPAVYLQGHWSRGTGDIANFVRAKDSLRTHVDFKVVNLIEMPKGVGPFKATEKFDVIFCRNVFIYFTREQTAAIVKQFMSQLEPDGHIFIGLSESLNGMELPLDWVGPSVYEIKAPSGAKSASSSATGAAAPTAKATPLDASVKHRGAITPTKTPFREKKIRVLTVDDSPTVLGLFAKMLSDAPEIEIVGTASNGREAAEKAKSLRPDVITLDVHMPEVDGVQYLERYHAAIGIPVIMVSSVSRDDSAVALRALELGASDYVEKPSINNLQQIKEELIFKLHATADLNAEGGSLSSRTLTSVDSTPKRPPVILKPEGKLRIVCAPFAARDEVRELIAKFRAPQPPTVVLFDGGGVLLGEWLKKEGPRFGARTEAAKSEEAFVANSVHVGDIEELQALVKRSASGQTASIMVLGRVSDRVTALVKSLPKAHLIIEDRGHDTAASLKDKATQVVPVTSFVYESDRFFANAQDSKAEPKAQNVGASTAKKGERR